MNFISQTLSNLTSGGKLYIFFQIIYLIGALFFTYVQIQILNALKGEPVATIISTNKFKEYRIEYVLQDERSTITVIASSSKKAIAHIKSIYPDATSIICLEEKSNEID